MTDRLNLSARLARIANWLKKWESIEEEGVFDDDPERLCEGAMVGPQFAIENTRHVKQAIHEAVGVAAALPSGRLRSDVLTALHLADEPIGGALERVEVLRTGPLKHNPMNGAEIVFQCQEAMELAHVEAGSALRRAAAELQGPEIGGEPEALPANDFRGNVATHTLPPAVVPETKPPAAMTNEEDKTLALTLAVVQMLAPDYAEEIQIARDESRILQDRLEELFRRDRRFHGWSYTRLGKFCGESRQAITKAIKKSEILTACRVGEMDD